jgi:hypothetical protein
MPTENYKKLIRNLRKKNNEKLKIAGDDTNLPERENSKNN